MTHDELLEKIDWIGHSKNAESRTATVLSVAVLASLNALRAVVELHRPFNIPEKYKNEDTLLKQGLACYLCSTEMYLPYPCPTIRTIEKELK
jgi:uncharacterized alpha/beta hydrolase family protein